MLQRHRQSEGGRLGSAGPARRADEGGPEGPRVRAGGRTQLGGTETGIAQGGGPGWLSRIEFGQELGSGAVRHEEFHDREGVDLLASGSTSAVGEKLLTQSGGEEGRHQRALPAAVEIGDDVAGFVLVGRAVCATAVRT